MLPSKGSLGDCYDSALPESFFATLEYELLDRNSFCLPKRGWRSLTSSRAATIPSGGIRRWTICYRPATSSVFNPRLETEIENCPGKRANSRLVAWVGQEKGVGQGREALRSCGRRLGSRRYEHLIAARLLPSRAHRLVRAVRQLGATRGGPPVHACRLRAVSSIR